MAPASPRAIAIATIPFLPAVVACAGDDTPAVSLEPVIAEACLHAQHGPYRDQTASADLRETVSDVDRPHTAYRVALPASGDGYLGALLYTPRHDALYAFLVDRDPVLELRDSSDLTIPPADQLAVDGCPALTHVVTAELAAEVPYRLILGPHAAPDVLLVIENVEELAP
jgi:hypothetical protein